MANVLERQITQEGPRNCVVKFTGTLDTSDIAEIPAIALSDCTNNDQNLRLIGYRIDLLEWSISSGLEINISWQSTTPQQIFPLAGRGRIYGANYGGFLPDATRTGYTGGISLVSVGYVAGSKANFSIVLELVKLYAR